MILIDAWTNEMTAAKYFGEEKLEDAIYAIYLRKVRYVSPSNIELSVFSFFFFGAY